MLIGTQMPVPEKFFIASPPPFPLFYFSFAEEGILRFRITHANLVQTNTHPLNTGHLLLTAPRTGLLLR
jgi:hypothetical protein